MEDKNRMVEKLWNDGWEYWESKNAFAFLEDGRIGESKMISLPHDAMLEKAANPNSSNSFPVGYRDGGIYNYRKSILVPLEWKNQTNLLKFEGVYMNAFVYINHEFAGKCHNGYNTFYIELDRFLNYGEENEILVVAKNDGMKNSRWYSGGGIYRDVYLVQSGLTRIEQESLRVKTTSVDQEMAMIKVAFDVSGRLPETKELKAVIRIKDNEEQVVMEESLKFILFEGVKKSLQRELLIQQAKLWSAETPNLYTVEVSLLEKEMQVDYAEDFFGIRVLSVDSTRGLRVNGKAIKLKGTCIHHDSGILGAASYETAHIRQMTKLKEAGFNAIRMAHHPMGQAMLRACDKVGMYVMDETFDMWNISKNDGDYSMYFTEEWKETLYAMVAKDYNHPSVIMYSLGNEIPECGSPHGVELRHEMMTYVKKLDSNRYITEGINGVFAARGDMGSILQDIAEGLKDQDDSTEINNFMTIMQKHMPEIVKHPIIGNRIELAAASLDIVGYNYMASRYEFDKENYPNRVIIGSETYPPKVGEEWDVIEACPNTIGEFTWAGWDYIGEVGVGIWKYAPIEPMQETRYPNQLAYVGDIDITGYRRPMSYLRQIVFEKKKTPYIAVQDPNHYGEEQVNSPWILSDARRRWNWENCEGKPVVVEVYSAAEEVELLVNGKTFGRQKTGRENGYRTLFHAVYQKGNVEAISYERENVAGRDILYSATNQRHIRIEAEQEWGEDLIFLNITLVDNNGYLATDAMDKIKIEVDGAMLLGFGSGSYAPLYNYNEITTNLFEGRAQAILKRNNKTEEIKTRVWLTDMEGIEKNKDSNCGMWCN